ncbi:glucosamine-6-phosphate deaminase, partial [Opitutales bacterium]|nr:glucosamine-6-phosphate deaminase [Opitutales bacterium]
MEVIIASDQDIVALKCADIIESQIKTLPDSVLGLATGSTPVGLYKELIKRHREHGLDFTGVRTFNLDEYIGIPANHPQSYRTFMNQNLFDPINIISENTYVPDGMGENPLDSGPLYEKKIKDTGGIDLQVLGVGTDGHIGFNEPTSSLQSKTRIKTLTPQTLEDN